MFKICKYCEKEKKLTDFYPKNLKCKDCHNKENRIRYNKRIKTTGIYKITSPSGRVYIGETIDIKRRFNEYRKFENKNQIKGQTKLYNSLQKYGYEIHKFEIIEECSEEQLNEREIYWIKFYNSVEEGLNIRLGKRRGKLSQETKDKISKALKGRKITWNGGMPKGFNYSEESKKKISESLKIYYQNNLPPVHPKILSIEKVIEIRNKFSTGKFTKSDLSREYNVSWGTIKNVVDKLYGYKD